MDAPKGITSDTIEKLKAALSPQGEQVEESPPAAKPEANQEPSDEGEQEPQPEVRTFKVKVDGEELEVPEDELLKGYSRTKDYTKKTQKLSEERKSFEADYEAVKSEREQYSKALDALKGQLQSVKEPDWDKLVSEDPIEFVKQKEFWRDRKEQFALIEQEQRRLADVHSQEQQKALQKYLQDEQSRLLDAIPEWKDAKKAQADRDKILSFAKSLGYSEAETAQIYDHRAVVALRKAALYDEMMSNAKSQVEKAKDSPRAARPGNLKPATSAKEFTQAREQLKTRGRVDDFVTAFKALQRTK
jgi:hypothetical protein